MAQTYNSSLEKVAYQYIKLLGAKVTETSIIQKIQEDPFYPSLYSLSNTFNDYNIDNGAYKINSNDFKELEPPFLAFQKISNVGTDFVLVTNITESQVEYLYNTKRTIKQDKEIFLNNFKNIICIAELNDQSGEVDYIKNLKKKRIAHNKTILWILSAALILLYGIATNITANNLFSFSSIILLKLAGTAISVLLLVYMTDKENLFVKNICTGTGKTDCGAVLNSKGSKIFNMSWSEIGFFYFSSTSIFLLLPTTSSFENKTIWIGLSSSFAAPYVLYSIYYQWKILNEWCFLCLATQFILVLELMWSIVVYWSHPQLHGLDFWLISNIITCILLPVLIWFALKPILIKAKDRQLYKNAFFRLQSHPDTFRSLLKQQPKVTEGWEQLGIDIGNPNATNTIIKVCNPYCGPCATAHSLLEGFIYNNDVKVKIIFTASNKENDRAAIVVKHLLAIAAVGNTEVTRQALDDWYLAKNKNYEKFALKYPSPKQEELKLLEIKIAAMRKWCDETEIIATPTLFVNEYKLPENYTIEQLKIIL